MTTASFANRGFPEQFLTLNDISDADLEATVFELVQCYSFSR